MNVSWGMCDFLLFIQSTVSHSMLKKVLSLFPLQSVISPPLLSLILPHQFHAPYSVYSVFSYLVLYLSISHSLSLSAFLFTLSATWRVLMKASSSSCSQHLQPTPIFTPLIDTLLLSPCKSQLLKTSAGRERSVFLCMFVCAYMSVCAPVC